MKLSFPRLLSRAQPVRPATVQVHTDNDMQPPWLDNHSREAWPPEPPVDYYAPKRPPLDPVTDFLLSLSPDRRARLSRLVRHGYFGGSVGSRGASNVVQFRMAA